MFFIGEPGTNVSGCQPLKLGPVLHCVFPLASRMKRFRSESQREQARK
jgi:hypothetical protein